MFARIRFPAAKDRATPDADDIPRRELVPVRAWLAWLALAALLAAALAWGWYGEVAQDVEGQGMLLRPGGSFAVLAAADGVYAEAQAMRPGDAIKRGQLLARIPQPALQLQLVGVREELSAYGARQPIDYPGRARAAERLHVLELQERLASQVRSPEDGVLVEAMVRDGASVRAGQPLLHVERRGRALEAVLYVPAASRIKQVRPGMAVEIEPADAPRARHGALRGRVLSVSPYPASEAGMLAVIPHAQLVQALAQQGPVHAVTVALEAEHASANGYAWTNPAGTTVTLAPGTRATARIALASVRPLALLLPWLERG